MRIFITSVAIGLMLVSCSTKPIRLATTTSVDNSGLLDYLLPDFEKATGNKVHVIAVGTGKAIRLARDGEADAVLVHAPSLEGKFVRDGYGIERVGIMYNNFVILGPADDPAQIKGKGLLEALKAIKLNQSTFVSRGDGSGTHVREKDIWNKAQIVPSGRWYHETGQGMGATLIIASEKKGYVLTDRATFIAMQDKLDLSLLLEGDPIFFNPYSIIAVNPQKIKSADLNGAKQLIDFFTQDETKKKITAFKKHGEQLFYPSKLPSLPEG